MDTKLLAKNLSSVQGHALAKELLVKSLALDNMAVYLLVGPPHVGKNSIAKNIAAGVHESADPTHPDTISFNDILLANESSSAQTSKPWKESVDKFIRMVNLSPIASKYKVAIIEDIDRLSVAATNALLKTLEEPPGNSIIILTAQSVDGVLPTIRSRSQIIRLNYISDEEIKKYIVDQGGSQAEDMVVLSNGSVGLANRLLNDSDFLQSKLDQLDLLTTLLLGDVAKNLDLANISSREQAIDLVTGWLVLARRLLVGKENSFLARKIDQKYEKKDLLWLIDRLNEAYQSLSAGANPRVALEALVLGWSWRGSRQV